MASPLYFFPSLTTQALLHAPSNRLIGGTLARYGLLEQFGDIKDAAREVAVWETGTKLGPQENLQGVMLRAYVRQPDGSMLAGQAQGFFPERQTWHHMVDVDATQLWVGVENDAPPTPQDLRRPALVRGYDIELLDGREWHVPVIRTPWDATHLPQAMLFDEHHKYSEPLLSQYQPVFDAFSEVVSWFMGGEFLLANRPRALELNTLALGLNYRYGAHEARLLKLISTVNYLDVLAAAIDWPKVLEISAEKKTASDAAPPPSNTLLGPADGSPATDPVGET